MLHSTRAHLLPPPSPPISTLTSLLSTSDDITATRSQPYRQGQQQQQGGERAASGQGEGEGEHVAADVLRVGVAPAAEARLLPPTPLTARP
eukprot:1557874-Rhodomonas_salina.1